jgi:hypothetical protein
MHASAVWAARLADKAVIGPACVDVVFGQLSEAIYRAELLAEHP